MNFAHTPPAANIHIEYHILPIGAAVFWQMTARNNESDLRAGKALRKDAFELAQERFNEMRPQLEVLEKEMEENEAELVKAKARSKEEGADRMMSRNRR